MSSVTEVQTFNLLGGMANTGQTGQTDKDMFLELLVAQMRYQDPLNPLEGADFTAQLAQFSSLEQLQNMSSSLDASIQADMLLARSINNTLAATIVGKSIRAVSDEVQYDGENSTPINFELSGQASRVKMEIVGTDGKVLRTLTETGLDEGDHAVEWDGRDQRGNEVPAGTYQVQISAESATGESITAQPLAIGRVTGVRFVDGNPVLLVNGREIPFGSVLEINETGSSDQNSVASWIRQLFANEE